MKTTISMICSSFVLTLCLYVIAYYVLPVPPSANVVVLFAGIAVLLVLAMRLGWRKFRSRKKGATAVLIISALLAVSHRGYAKISAQEEREVTGDPSKTSPLCRLGSGPMAGTIVLKPEEAAVGQPC
jgi:hypothetical protein